MSHFENMNGWLGSKFVAIVATILLSVSPRLAIACCGAFFTVSLLTDGKSVLLFFIWYERSKMHLNLRVLCGIMATGEIFIFGGMLCFISPHLMMVAYPPFILLSVSSRRHVLAAFDFADMCGPLFIAAMMCSVVQFGPQLTGQPLEL
jgi:hypothetical protein